MTLYKCPGFEVEPTVFSGCDPRRGNDCPVCEGRGVLLNCPCCGDPLKNNMCLNGCWFPLEPEI